MNKIKKSKYYLIIVFWLNFEVLFSLIIFVGYLNYICLFFLFYKILNENYKLWDNYFNFYILIYYWDGIFWLVMWYRFILLFSDFWFYFDVWL